MRLAYSSNGFKRYDLLKTIDLLSEIGYEGIEILLDIPHAFPPEVTNEKILMIKDKLKQRNMTISNLNAFMLYGIKDNWHPSFVEVDETERRQRIEHTHNCIDLAQKLGAKTLSTEPGDPSSM